MSFCLFVCFKGGMGTGACPGSPLYLTNVSVFTEDPQSCEFPLQHYSGLGTLTIRQTFGNWYRKKLRLHYTKAKNFLTVFTELSNLYPKVQLCSFQFESHYGIALVSDCSSLYLNCGLDYLQFLYPIGEPCKQSPSIS